MNSLVVASTVLADDSCHAPCLQLQKLWPAAFPDFNACEDSGRGLTGNLVVISSVFKTGDGAYNQWKWACLCPGSGLKTGQRLGYPSGKAFLTVQVMKVMNMLDPLEPYYQDNCTIAIFLEGQLVRANVSEECAHKAFQGMGLCI
ncbi:hypothetical protein BCR33DRAFT_787645 [Rhizoclosmatium globosum]|uniref:Uncharacterized protein n=1 Tax=Rhizoclosmatium globosum TaxID=329046 RepID=A0A1Y2C101_9FUNG|nr:hypothetical protein BCR33DRAFT_787645 [Rhizoclosmatium globosum]|eukprot:ORY40557.1 hypothetical protein BCR33DRAFT_787645 [Rhizoclosmatium globosum]